MRDGGNDDDDDDDDVAREGDAVLYKNDGAPQVVILHGSTSEGASVRPLRAEQLRDRDAGRCAGSGMPTATC